VRRLDAVLPLLQDGMHAEAAHEYGRAAQDYSQALALDRDNPAARAGLARAHAGFGADNYARAVGTGYASLGAGRLEEAQAHFDEARRLDPRGRDALHGLERVEAALRARRLAQARTRLVALEAQERWGEALQGYDELLAQDPSLGFARQGRARVLAHPDPRQSNAQSNAQSNGQSKTVHLALVSDNATHVQIPEIGSFGTFSRREIDLKPGRYTVIGTRTGYRDVRRDVTVAPGEDVQTINVRCIEPI
jgi:tetratricopeptide (TPR) repeat protein